jgi:D-beta-D-heptose 7-phosphate kinase/D-beta-D-heptose 1-phosphate adenosyltransferase
MTKKVFVNGTFDILHRGHLELLEYAKSQGDVVVVAIDSDERVKEKKGPTRPINTAEDRAYMLSSLKTVDHVLLFNSDLELENCVKVTNPDIMVVGSDWEGKSVIGSMFSAEVHFFPRLEDYATSKTIQSIIDRR